MRYKLDAYEQEIEDNYEKAEICNDKEERTKLIQAARSHIVIKINKGN